MVLVQVAVYLQVLHPHQVKNSSGPGVQFDEGRTGEGTYAGCV